MNPSSGITNAPAYTTDRTPLAHRASFDFRDYGFEIARCISELFEVAPAAITEEECLLFFFPREDVARNSWALFNLHVFLKRTGPLEEFAHGLGESVRTIPLLPATAFNKPGLGYSRTIAMRDLFKGAESVITNIGSDPDRIVRDSHFYFMHHHDHCYTGVLHQPGLETRYDALRQVLFDSIKFAD